MISKTKIESAKRGDLPGTLGMLGIELIRSGNGYQSALHDSLKLFKQDGIWLYKWWSHNGEVGDGIQYLQRYCNMNFMQAVQCLSKSPVVSTINHAEVCWQGTPNWQQKSNRLIHAAHNNLMKPNGKERLKYLVETRGLRIDTIRSCRLGWLPSKCHMPSKLVIPCYNSQGKIIRIRFRIDNPLKCPRYRISKDSDPSSPYPIRIERCKPVIIVETELDALLIAQEAGDFIGVMGIGSTSVELTSRAIEYLNLNIPFILICMDNDQSGRDKALSLMEKLPKAFIWPVPEEFGKDPGEVWHKINLRKWIELKLKELSGNVILTNENINRQSTKRVIRNNQYRDYTR